MSTVRTRTAPSPTGEPHVGNYYAALINYVFAKKHGGRFIIRIEDTDRARFVEDSEGKLYQAYDWLGFHPDEGPIYGGDYGPYRQSERLEFYQKYAQELVEKGSAYYCWCSPERLDKIRQNQQVQGLPPKYDRYCLNPQNAKGRSLKEPHVVRLKIPLSGETKFNDLIRGEIIFKNELLDDQILLKSDGFPTYHLAVIVDDHLMLISHVIRAEEWISSTPKHILLYRAFGWELPCFAHLPLLRNPDRSKLSKRKNPTSILWYRDWGFLPEALINYLALMGWSHPEGKEIFDLQEFIEKFDISRIDPAGPIFDLKKLEWLNGEYIRKNSIRQLADQIYNFYHEKYPEDFIKKTIPLVQERIKKLSEYAALVDFIFEEELKTDLAKVKKLLLDQNHGANEVKNLLSAFYSQLSTLSPESWKTEIIGYTLDQLYNNFSNNWVKRNFYMILRIAVSGATVGPPLNESLELLGKEKTLQRIKRTMESLNNIVRYGSLEPQR